MLQSNHDLDLDYRHGSPYDDDGARLESDAVKDIDISFLVLFAEKCLPCCLFYRKSGDGDDVGDGDDPSAGSHGSSFSELTRSLLEPSREGDGRREATTTAENAVGTHQNESLQGRTLVNKNVFLYFLLRFLQGTADSLWRGTILSIFVVELTTGSNGKSEYFKFVGYLEGMFGLGQIIALMLYHPGDDHDEEKGRRSEGRRQLLRDEINHTPGPGRQNCFTLKCAGLILVVTAAANIILLAKLPSGRDYRLFYQLLMPVLLFYGYSSSVLFSSSAAHTLLRDSTGKPTAEHFPHKNLERPLQLSSHVIGPVISIILFAALGNDYSLGNLRILLYVGSAMELLVGLMGFGFSEKYYVTPLERGDEEDAGSDRESGSRDQLQGADADRVDDDDDEEEIDDNLIQLQQRIDRVFDDEEPTTSKVEFVGDAQQAVPEESPSVSSSHAENLSTHPNARDGRTEASADRNKKRSATLSLLPPIFFLQAALFFVKGGALFYSYWPVFLKDVPRLPPIELQLLYAAVPLVAMICDASWRYFGHENTAYFGVNVVLRVLAAIFAVLIASLSSWGASSVFYAILFLSRMACIESAELGAAEEYMLGENYTPATRSGVKMATLTVYSICAAVGGAVIEAKSYSYTLYLVGVLESAGLAFMVAMILSQKYQASCRDDQNENESLP